MKIKTDEITSVLKQEIEQFGAELEVSEVGRVVEVGDGIARVYGLAKAMSGELVEFDTSKGPVMGQVMNLEPLNSKNVWHDKARQSSKHRQDSRQNSSIRINDFKIEYDPPFKRSGQ